VNCICPGPFLTRHAHETVERHGQNQKFSDRTALQRWGQPREVAGPVLMLASEAGSYIAGEALVIDGGVMAHTL